MIKYHDISIESQKTVSKLSNRKTHNLVGTGYLVPLVIFYFIVKSVII